MGQKQKLDQGHFKKKSLSVEICMFFFNTILFMRLLFSCVASICVTANLAFLYYTKRKQQKKFLKSILRNKITSEALKRLDYDRNCHHRVAFSNGLADYISKINSSKGQRKAVMYVDAIPRIVAEDPTAFDPKQYYISNNNSLFRFSDYLKTQECIFPEESERIAKVWPNFEDQCGKDEVKITNELAIYNNSIMLFVALESTRISGFISPDMNYYSLLFHNFRKNLDRFSREINTWYSRFLLIAYNDFGSVLDQDIKWQYLVTPIRASIPHELKISGEQSPPIFMGFPFPAFFNTPDSLKTWLWIKDWFSEPGKNIRVATCFNELPEDSKQSATLFRQASENGFEIYKIDREKERESRNGNWCWFAIGETRECLENNNNE